METIDHPQYKCIEVQRDFTWPFHLKRDVVRGIKNLEQWLELGEELGRFLDDGNELNMGQDTLLMKMKGVFVVTEDTAFNEEKINNRERYPFVKLDPDQDVCDGKGNHLYKDKIAVINIFRDLDETMLGLRDYLGIGYETRIVDLWNNGEVVVRKQGRRML